MASQYRQEEGQDIIEYALILPFLLLITFSIIEGGFLISRYNTVANAAREGARAGIVAVKTSDCTNPNCVAEITQRARDAAKALVVGLEGFSNSNIDVTVDNNTVTVAIEYQAGLITGPLIQGVLGSATVPLTATSVMQRE